MASRPHAETGLLLDTRPTAPCGDRAHRPGRWQRPARVTAGKAADVTARSLMRRSGLRACCDLLARQRTVCCVETSSCHGAEAQHDPEYVFHTQH